MDFRNQNMHVIDTTIKCHPSSLPDIMWGAILPKLNDAAVWTLARPTRRTRNCPRRP